MDFFSEQYIEKHSIPEPMSGCWLWLGQLDKDGYGQFRTDQKSKWHKAHRVSYKVHYGEIGTFYVLHRCDVPACVNPGHLFLGTHFDNVRDMDIKGRRGFGAKFSKIGLPTHCRHGHEMTGENLMFNRKGKRYCRSCNILNAREWRACHALECS